MARKSTLSISLASLDADAADKALRYELEVTHLTTHIVAAGGNGQPLVISPGIKIIIPGEDAVSLLIDGEAYRLAPGMALTVSGGVGVAVAPVDAAEDSGDSASAMHVIEINARVSAALPLQDILDLPLLLESGSAETAARIFEQLTFGQSSAPLFPGELDISLHVAAITLMTTLLRAAAESSGSHAAIRRDRRVQRLREYLFANINRSVEIPEMARHLGMSRATFFRWSKQTLGCPPLKYLRVLRLERCQEWIAQDAGSLAQIAYQTGFADCGHLGREFKKHFGMTPGQYRKMARSYPEADFLARAAERYFSHGRFDEALAACEQCLKSNAPRPVLDRVRYQKGLCLRALGRGRDAIPEWHALRAGGFSHRAGIQECKQVFRADAPGEALELLQELYSNAAEFQRQDVLTLWIDQVKALREARKPRPLREYLAFRKKRFPHESRTMGAAVNALRMLGDNMEILEQCGELTISCFNALRRAGRYDEAVERYGENISRHSIIQGAYLQGRHEDVLAMEPLNPYQVAASMVALGRPEEAILHYPDHSACAYLALGRYEDLLDRFPISQETAAARTHSLIALGRKEEIAEILDNPVSIWLWMDMQLHYHPEAILESSHPDAHRYTSRTLTILTCNALLAGNRLEAEASLDRIDGIRAPDFWWYDHNGTELLVTAVLREMLDIRQDLRDDLNEIVANHKFKDKQCLWHDAAYLSKQITDAEFLNQPQQRRVKQRLEFIKAVKADLDGRHDAARRGYEASRHSPMPFEAAELIRERFADWRLQEL